MVTENEIECLATITCQENDVPDNRCNITYEQFMDATQTESIALFTTNENGVLTNLNPSCADLCQIKSTQIPQNTWTNILYPDVTHLQNKWKNYCKLQTQNKFHITIANPDKLNEESVHDIFCYPKLDKNQAIIGYSGMIKPKPETQTNLLQNNAYLYDQIDTCIIQLNPAGDIVYSNPACNKLLNLNSQPPVFTLENFFQHIPSDDRKSLLIRIKKYLNNKSSAKKFHTKCRLIDKTNSQKIKYLIFQLTQINSAKSHEILGYFGRVIDTTETVNLQNRDTIKSNLMRIGTYEMNLAGNLTNWEGQGENDPGYEYHFLEGDGWINTVHPEDKQALGMKWIQHIKSKSSQPLTISCRLITVNKTIWIKAITIAIIDVDNKISHYYGEMFDITHECKNQAELNSISREFKLIENKHPIGILRSDLNNNIYLNKNTSIMITGTKNSSFTLDEWEHYIHPDDKLKASSSWRQYIAKPVQTKPWSSTHRYMHENGDIIYTKNYVTPELNNQNLVVGYIGTITDITQETETRLKLEALNNQLNNIFEASPVGHIRVSYINNTPYFYRNKKAFTQITGDPNAQVNNTKQIWINHIHPDDKHIIELWNNYSLSHTDTWNQEYRYLHSNGNIIWVKSYNKRSVDSIKNHSDFYYTEIDITEEKIKHIKIQSLYQQLNLIQSASSAWLYEKDLDCNYIYSSALKKTNKSLYKNLIHDDSFMNSKDRIKYITHPDDIIMHTKKHDLFLEDKKNDTVFNHSYRHLYNGKITWVRTYICKKIIDDNHVGYHGTTVDITTEKEKENELVKLTQKYQNLADLNAVGVYELNEYGKIIYVNKAFIDLHGANNSDIFYNEKYRALKYKNNPRELKDFLGFIANKTTKAHLETINFTTFDNKKEVCCSYITKPILNTEQKIIGYAGAAIDITKEIDYTALKKTSQLNYNLMHASSVGLWESDEFGVTTYYNEAFCNISGLKFSQKQQPNIWTYVHPDDLNKIKDSWLQYLESKQAVTWIETMRIVLPGDIITWVKAIASPNLNKEGKLVGHIGNLVDITKETNQEYALINTKYLLEQLKHQVNGLQTATNSTYCVLDYKDNTILQVSNSFVKFSGYEINEILQLPYSTLCHSVDVGEIKNWLQDKNQLNKPITHRFITKNTYILWVECQAEIINFNASLNQVHTKPMLYLYIKNITTMHQNNQLLLQYKQLLDVNYEAIIQVDIRTYEIKYMNKLAKDLFAINNSDQSSTPSNLKTIYPQIEYNKFIDSTLPDLLKHNQWTGKTKLYIKGEIVDCKKNIFCIQDKSNSRSYMWIYIQPLKKV